MLAVVRFVAVVIAACLALPTAPFAQSAADSAAAWGLIGTWQPRCGAPFDNNSNPIYLYRISGALVILDRQFGDDRSDTNAISSVRRGPKGELLYSVHFTQTDPPQTREHMWLKSANGQAMRIVSNRDVNTGQFSVADGKFTDNGATTPWMNRCN
jgi:hypothetical protein